MEENSVQISSILAVWLLPSFGHLIGSIQHRLRIREADLLGGFEINHQLEFRRLLHWQIGGFCSLEYLINGDSGATVDLDLVGRIRHKA